MAGPRAIIHVDMDAFYAAIEQLDNPEWRGKPLVVGQLGRRSVVSTCSYEARPFGVRSAMPTLTAQRLCPHAIFVTPRMDRYREISRIVFSVFAEVTPEIEGLSLDEAFLDVTRSLRLFGGSVEPIGRYLKDEIRLRTGLAASVGMAANKLLAKLASEISKPDGFLHIVPELAQGTLDPLPVGRLWTVGRVAEAALKKIGIHTVGDLRHAGARRVGQVLGRQAQHLIDLASGIDDRPVVADAAEKSISAETTFDDDLATFDQSCAWLARLAERVGERVRAHQLVGRTITVKLRRPPFETSTRQVTLPLPTDSTDAIYAAGRALLQTWWDDQAAPSLRLVGIGMSSFGAVAQAEMFGATRSGRDALADEINRRFGGGSLVRGVVLKSQRDEDA